MHTRAHGILNIPLGTDLENRPICHLPRSSDSSRRATMNGQGIGVDFGLVVQHSSCLRCLQGPRAVPEKYVRLDLVETSGAVPLLLISFSRLALRLIFLALLPPIGIVLLNIITEPSLMPSAPCLLVPPFVFDRFLGFAHATSPF